MAAAVASACHSDPNFAVICCFLEKYGEILGLPVISFVDLQEYLEDTKTVSRPLIDLHVRLLKRIGKTNVNHERFERSVTKFCFYFSDRDGWEMERFGYKHTQLSTKLRVLKNLLECQFDYNIKFKEKINELQPEELRFLPAGRDRDGLTYWYLLDKDLNVHVYREEPDDETADTWKLICSDRDELASLLERLKNNTQRNFDKDDKDDKSSIFTDESKTTSKEGSPDRDSTTPSLTLTSVKEETDDVKHEPPDDQTSMTSDDVKSAMSVDESSQVSVTSAPQPTTGSAGDEDLGSVTVKEEPVVQDAETGDGGSGRVQLCVDGEDTKALTDTRTDTTPVTTSVTTRTDTSPTRCHPTRDQSSPSAANTASVTEHSCDLTAPHSHPSHPSHTDQTDRQQGDPSDSVITTTITTGAHPHTPSIPDNTDRASREGGSSDSRTKDIPSPATTQDPSPEQKGRDGGSLESGSEMCVPGGESQTPAGTSNSREGVSGQERGEVSHTVGDSPELLQGQAESSHSKTDRSGSSPGGHRDMGDRADLPCETAKEGVEKQTTSRGLTDQIETSSDRSPDRPLSADTEPMETKSSEKAETKSSEEKAETKSSEEQAETKSSEEQAETKSSEEKETKSSEEKAETKSSEEKAETKSSEEQAETKSSEEKAETKSSEKKSETKSSEEQAETKSSEEQAETKSSEEKETKSSEDKPETKHAEETLDSNKAEETLDSNKAEEKADSNKAEETLDSNKAEEKADSNKAEETLDSNKAEEKADSNKAEEKADSEKAEDKLGPGETKNTEEKSDGKESQTSGDKAGPTVCPGEDAACAVSSSESPGQSSQGTAAAYPQALKGSDLGTEDPPSCDQHQDQAATTHSPATDREQPSTHSSHQCRPAEAEAEPTSPIADRASQKDSVHTQPEGQGSADGDQPSPGGEESMDTETVCESSSAGPCVGTVPECEAKGARPSDPGSALPGHVDPVTRATEENNDLVSSEETKEQTDTPPHTDGLQSASGEKITDLIAGQSENDKQDKETQPVGKQTADEGDADKDAKKEDGGQVNKTAREKVSESPEKAEGSDVKGQETEKAEGSDVKGQETEKAEGSDVKGQETERAEGSDVKGQETEKAEGSDVKGQETEQESSSSETAGTVVKADPDSRAEVSGQQPASSVGPPDHTTDQQETMPSEDTGCDKSALPSSQQAMADKNVQSHSSTASDTNQSADVPQHSDEKSPEQEGDTETGDHSADQRSAEGTGESQTLPSVQQGQLESRATAQTENRATDQTAVCEDSPTQDPTLTDSDQLTGKRADLSSAKGGEQAKVVDNQAESVDTSSSGPTDKPSGETPADSRDNNTPKSPSNDKNMMAETKDSKDSSVCGGDKEPGKPDSVEGEKEEEKTEGKDADPPRSRPLRKRRGKAAVKAGEAAQTAEADSLKTPRTRGKRKGDGQDTPTDKQQGKPPQKPETENKTKTPEKQTKVNTADKQNKANSTDKQNKANATDKQNKANATARQKEERGVKSTEDQEGEGLVNGHTDLLDDADDNDAHPQPSKTPRGRGRGRSRSRGSRGGRGGSRGAKRSAAQMEEEETSAAPAEKRAKRGGGKRRGAGGRGQQLAKSVGKEGESSSDSNTPLINCKGHSKPATARGPKKAAGSRKMANKDADSSSSDDLPLSKAAKKKKIVGEDSSDFEPDEPIAPCKKSRGSKTSKPATKTKKKEQDSAKKDDDSSTVASAYSTRRSLRIQTMKKKEPDPDFDILSEAEQSGELSSEVELPTEEDSEDDDFKPHQGRNRRRQAALKKKEEEKVPMDDTPCIFCEKCTHPDMMLLCDSCDKGYHMACLRPPLMAIPEGDWFCPPCEHIKLIDKLTEYLRELDTNSRKKDRLVRRKERLAFVGISLDNILKEEKKPVVPQRKRLTRDEEEEEEEEEEETEVEDNENDDDYVRPRRQKNKYSRGSQHRPSHRSRHGRKRHERQQSDDEEGGGLPEEVYAKRTCRTRSTVSYQFKEYDDLIKSAIQEDLSDPKPPRPPKPPGRNRGKDLSGIPGMYSDEGEEEMEAEDLEEEGKKGIGKDIDNILGQKSDKEEEEEEEEKEKKGKSRGKDMSNILGMDSDEEKELRRKQKEEALAAAAASEGRPPPVVKRKKQKRRLTMLDSDDNQDDEDESEEFQISESDEDSEASAEGSQDDDDDDDLTEEDSGAWRPRRTWFNKAASRRGASGKGGRRSRSSRFDDFVVDDDYDSDERASKRRSTRNSTKRRVRYRDWESDTEESEMETEESEASLSELSSDDSEYRRRKRRQQKSRKKFTSETETSGSEYMVKVNRAKKRRVASSDSEEDSASFPGKKSSKNKKPSKASKANSKASKANSKAKRGRRKEKSSEDDSATEVEEEEAPKKKKNVLRDSSSEDGGNPQGGELEYGEDEDTEVEGDSQQPGPLSQTVSHKVTATGPQSEVKVTEKTTGESQCAISVRDRAEASSAMPQESVQGLEAAPEQTKEPEKAKGVGVKGRKARGKGKGKKAVSQGEEGGEGDRPERVECGTDVQDDIPVSLLKATPPALKPTAPSLPIPPALVKPASSAVSGLVVPQNPPPNFLHVEGPSGGGSEGGDRVRQNLPPHSAPTPPADLPFQRPPGPRFRAPLEGGVPPQFEHYPHPRPMGPQEGMRYPAPFPHGPYPLPGEGFRGPQPDRMPAPTPERFFRPQAMVPYEGEGGRPPSQAGVGRGDGFRPPFSQGERLHYPYRPPGPDSFQGVGRGFRPQGPHSEGSGTGVGPGLEGLRTTGPVHPFHHPSSAGQTGFQPPTSSHDSFRPQLSGPDTHRATGQEGLAGVRPGHRPPSLESGHPPGHRAPGLESGHPPGHRPPGLESGHTSGQDQTQQPSQDCGPPSTSQPEGLQQSGATEGMASPGAERFPMPGQKGFQPAQSAMERFRTPYSASEGFRPGQEGFGPPGAGQGFRFVQPSDFRPHGHPRASSVRPEVFQSPSASHTRFPPAGPPQEGFLSGVRPPAANQGFKPPTPEGFRGPTPEGFRGPAPEGFRPPAPEGFRPPAPEGFRGPTPEGFRPPAPEGFRGPTPEGFRGPGPAPEGFRGPGPAPEDLRSSGPLQGFRPPVSGQERFGSPGPDTDRFRPHGPVSSFPGKGPGQKAQPTGPEGFQHAEPGQRFQTPAGSVQVSSTGQDIAQRMKVSESSKPSGTENLPTSSPSQDRAVPPGPAQAFPFQHGRYEAFPMGRGFWPPSSSFSAAGPHQGFWPPPGHPLRPSGPDSFPMVGHARGMHPSEHRPGFFPPAFRAAGMGEGGFPPGFRPPGQGEGLRPQEASGGDQYRPPALPYSKADPSAMQSAPVQDPALPHGSSGHDFIHRQGGPAREEGREVNQGGAELTARRGSSASEDSDNQPQDLTVQSHKPGPQGNPEHPRRLEPCDPGGRREQCTRPGSQVSDEASTPVDLSQQSKAPSLHSSQTDCPETRKSSGRDSAKPGDDCRSTASSEQGSEAQQTIPAAQGDQRPAVEGQTRVERRESTEHTAPQQQAEAAPSEQMPAPQPQPQTAARGSEEVAARGPSGLSKAVTSQALSGQKEGSEVDRQPGHSEEWNTAVAAGPKEGGGPRGLTAPEGSSGPLGPAQQPDRNLPQGPMRLTEQQEQPTPAVLPTQTEGESKATPVSPSSAEGSEEPKPEKPSDRTEGHKGMEPAGLSEQRGGSAGSSLQTNSSQAEESRSRDPGQGNVPSPQVKDVKDGTRQDETMLHQDSEPQESLKEKENTPQQCSVRNEDATPAKTAELSSPVSSDLQIKRQGSAEGSTGSDQEITQDAPASHSDELKSQEFSENKGEQRMDCPGPLGEALKAPGSEDEKHKLPGPEGEGFRPPSLSGEGLRYAGPPEERFQPPGPLGEGFRLPGPSEGFRPPGEGFRPPGPTGEGFRPTGPTGEGFRPPGHPGDLRAPDSTAPVPSGHSTEQLQSGAGGPMPGSEGGKSQAHTDGFRPPASAAGTFQPPGPGHGAEGFRLPMGAEGFRPPGPEGFHPHAPEGFHTRGFYPPFQGHPYYTGNAGQAFHAGFGMYPPHQFSSADPRMFGPHPGMGPHPHPYAPMMPPVSQVPGGPAGGRGGFMIDNLLRSKSGELPPPLMTPPVSSCAPHMTPPQSTPPHSTPPHGALPHATPAQSTPPHSTPPHATPPHATPPHTTPHSTPPHSTPPHCTPPHSTPPHCTPPQPSAPHCAPPSQHQQQMQQLQPLQSKTTATTVNSKGGKSPQPAAQGEEGDDNDVSQIMSYVMNDDFFRQQTSS